LSASFSKYNLKLTCLFIHAVQEILYHLIQGSNGGGSSRTHSIPSSSYGHDRTSNAQKLSGDVNCELQLAVDEALARELHEMESKLANTSLNDNNGQLHCILYIL
jgi:E3 ubiquitin-protein ligase BIG BROTHER and related proteins